MAAEVEALEGGIFRLKISTDAGTTYKIAALTTSLQFAGQTGEREITTIQNGGYDDFLPTNKNATISFEGLTCNKTVAGELNTNDLFVLWQNGTRFLFYIEPFDAIGSEVLVGEYNIKGTGFFTQFDKGMPQKENATVSMSIRVKGTFTSAAEV